MIFFIFARIYVQMCVHLYVYHELGYFGDLVSFGGLFSVLANAYLPAKKKIRLWALERERERIGHANIEIILNY